MSDVEDDFMCEEEEDYGLVNTSYIDFFKISNFYWNIILSVVISLSIRVKYFRPTLALFLPYFNTWTRPNFIIILIA